MKDGNEFVGVMISENNDFIRMNTEVLGEIQIPRKYIKKLEAVKRDRIVDGELWMENAQDTRYFWSPNGYGLKKGESYYQNIWIWWNQAAFGITDNFSMGGGVIPLFLFDGAPSPVWITPKFSIPVAKDKMNIGAGGLVGTVLGEGIGFGLFYGMTTFGSRDKNLSIGLGYGYAEGEWANAPIINLGGLLRIGRKGYLLTENYYINIENETVVLISLGGRSLIKRAGLDYGLFIPFSSDLDFFIAVPWLGLTIPFNGKSKN